jgi:hypothetical protein
MNVAYSAKKQEKGDPNQGKPETRRKEMGVLLLVEPRPPEAGQPRKEKKPSTFPMYTKYPAQK